MARDLNEFERIAVAITAAMRNDIEPLKALLAELRAAGHTDYTIGEMFMSVGAIVFDEGDVITEEEEEMKLNSGELIEREVNAERERIIAILEREVGNTSNPHSIRWKKPPEERWDHCCDAELSDSPYIAEDCCFACTTVLWLLAVIKGEEDQDFKTKKDFKETKND